MERHERYDPEDIESLLSQRGFDELLPEERAFVLRHLSGREEYEHMRALLHYVRPDERQRERIDPETRVRENVLATFRAHHQPQWRIWLNGISLWSAPKEASIAWRPVLAYGTLALVVVAGVVVLGVLNGGSQGNELAVVQVKEDVPRLEPVPKGVTAPAVERDDAHVVMDAEIRSSKAILEEQQAGAASGFAAAEQERNSNANLAKKDAEVVAMEDLVPPPTAGAAELAPAARTTPPSSITEGYSIDSAGSHLVTAVELSQNMSTTNATSKVAMEMASKEARMRTKPMQASRSMSMADTPELLALVTAGW